MNRRSSGCQATVQPSPACSGEIRQPNPTLDQVSLAASLDQTETASDGLGALFAETVLVHCD